MIDPRGPRVGAAITTVVLALVLVTGSAWLLVAQAVVFALGAVDRSPLSWLYQRVVRPRVGPPVELEDSRPPRFAQTVGLAFALLGVLGALVWSPLFLAATAAALAAAFLNAAFGYCLGCEMYLTVTKLSHRQGATA